ncbi:MAG: methyltetrahydrofolate cobalamin methyltransferase [Dehalobacterium sp.]
MIIGELINTSRKAIRAAVENLDKEYLQQIAKDQANAGADYIDINCGTQVDMEVSTVEWLVAIVQEVCDLPLCIDSPSPITLDAGLEAAKKNGRKQMINSISGESARYKEIIPLIKQYDAKVVALCMDDRGVPDTYEDRVEIVESLVAKLHRDGIKDDDIYLDPLIKPISTNHRFGLDVLNTVRYIREKHPQVHMTCGLSNVSFGLPNRKYINRYFMIQCMAAGMDSFILNPLDKEIMGAVYVSNALLGNDLYCSNYLKAHRKGYYNE